MEGFVKYDGFYNSVNLPRNENGGTLNQNHFVIADTATNCELEVNFSSPFNLITGRGVGTRIRCSNGDFFAATGGGAAEEPVWSYYRSMANTASIPNGRLWDCNANSGTSLGLEVGNRRTGGWIYRAIQLGSIVKNGAGDLAYICIQPHTSGSSTEPGVGADWEDYWERLPFTGTNVGASSWATSTAYVTHTERFRVDTDGKTGFFGATPAAQPAANPDTSGATLPNLEIEVNQIKAVLRTLGLIAT
jgi:hypothetical protein